MSAESQSAMSAESQSSPASDLPPGATPRRRSFLEACRSRGRFASIPIVIIGTIAMTLNLASPADAATILKKPLKAKSTLPAAIPAPAPNLGVARSSAKAVPNQYVVVEGDTVSGIGGRFGLSTASVLALNGLGWSSMIFPGQKLTLTNHAAAPAVVVAKKPVAAEITRYTVKSGDTISGIAAAHGLSTAAVLSANGLGRASLIFPGQAITLPHAASARTATAAPAPAPVKAAAPTPVKAAAPTPVTPGPASIKYTIVRGDTISGIAAAHGLSTAAVLSANGLSGSSIIFPGQALVLPRAAAPTTSTAAAAPAPPGPAPAPAKPAAPTPGPAAKTYTIAPGDTISTVASTAGVPVQSILDANGLGWTSIIYPGQVLTIPTIIRLTAEMRANAQIIAAVGRKAGVSDRGLVVALAAAAQESGLRNVKYGDRDSLGLFQQRPSAGWGTAEQVLDPVRASRAFFGGADNPNPGVTRGLLDIRGWESLTVTQAAQAVQVSAYPDHYANWEASAHVWIGELG